MRAARLLACILAALAAAVTIAACGGDDEDSGGPATIVPADAPAYLELLVQPEGEAADDAEAALGKVSGSDDPGGDLVELLERESADDGDEVDFSEEIEPWLGERAGTYPSSLAGDTDAVVIVETIDSERALDYLREQEDATGREGEYEGHSFEFDTDGDVFGVVEDFLVFGTEAGFEQVVDTVEGGDALADTSTFTESLDELPDDRLLSLYALPSDFLEAIPAREIDAQGRRIVLQALGEAGDEPILGSLTASADAVNLELSAAGPGPDTEQSELLDQVPSDSWLALAFADIGGSVGRALSQTEELGVPGLDADSLRRELRRETGFDIEQDVIAALGDAALFVSGTSEQSIGGALVIESKDADASAQLLEKVQDLIATEGAGEVEVEPLASTGGDQGFQVTDAGATSSVTGPDGPAVTQPITVIQRDDRIVAGYGGEAVNQALSRQGVEPLSGTDAFKGASDALGDFGVDAFVAIAPILQLAESAGASEDPGYEAAKPYLDALSYLAIGSGGEDDRAVVRFSLGLTE